MRRLLTFCVYYKNRQIKTKRILFDNSTDIMSKTNGSVELSMWFWTTFLKEQALQSPSIRRKYMLLACSFSPTSWEGKYITLSLLGLLYKICAFSAAKLSITGIPSISTSSITKLSPIKKTAFLMRL